MASEKKSFSELLSEAPAATSEKTVSLTGALARSNEPGKFVLSMGDNQTVTLDVDAVKDHKVLSGMVGQVIVQVEVDRDKVPAAATQVATEFRTLPFIDQHQTFPSLDTNPIQDRLHTVPFSPYGTDVITDVAPPKYIIENTGTIQENVVDPGNFGVDPAAGANFAQGFAPFALATPHQAPQQMLAMQYPSPQGFRTSPIWDHHTIYYSDKPPITDITGHFPYPD
jgi:hypothetical protein